MERYIVLEFLNKVLLAKITSLKVIDNLIPIDADCDDSDGAENLTSENVLCEIEVGEKAEFLYNPPSKVPPYRIEIKDGKIYVLNKEHDEDFLNEYNMIDKFFVSLKLNKDGKPSKRNKFILEFETDDDAALWAKFSGDNYCLHLD